MRTLSSEVRRERGKFTEHMPRQKITAQHCADRGIRRKKKEGKTKNNMEVYHRNGKNTCRLANMA